MGNTRDDKGFKSPFASKQATGYWAFWCWACYCIVMPRIGLPFSKERRERSGLLLRLAALLILPQLIYLIFFPYIPIRPIHRKVSACHLQKIPRKKEKKQSISIRIFKKLPISIIIMPISNYNVNKQQIKFHKRIVSGYSNRKFKT